MITEPQLRFQKRLIEEALTKTESLLTHLTETAPADIDLTLVKADVATLQRLTGHLEKDQPIRFIRTFLARP